MPKTARARRVKDPPSLMSCHPWKSMGLLTSRHVAPYGGERTFYAGYGLTATGARAIAETCHFLGTRVPIRHRDGLTFIAERLGFYVEQTFLPSWELAW